MSNPSDEFFNDIDYPSIINTIKGVYFSDATINSLLDFERVLDEADLYAYKNWELGELVRGPDMRKYSISCVFMYPEKLMPDPSGGKRLLRLGCDIKFKKTTISVPVKIESAEDYKPGTHYPKSVDRSVWLVYIQMPKDLMNDIKEGSIDLADQTIDLEDLDNAYEDDLDKEGTQDDEQDMSQAGAQGNMGGGMPAPGGMPPAPGGMM